MERMKIGYTEREEILKFTRGGHPQLACQRHFEVTHKGAEKLINMEGVGNHPNAFFGASMAYYKALNKEGEESGSSKQGEGSSPIQEGDLPSDSQPQESSSPMEVEEAA